MQNDLCGKVNQRDRDRGRVLAGHKDRCPLVPHFTNHAHQAVNQILTVDVFMSLVEHDQFVEKHAVVGT